MLLLQRSSQLVQPKSEFCLFIEGVLIVQILVDPVYMSTRH